MDYNGKKILIGITGGIAAYKICELVRLFKKNGAEVRVIMTPSAAKFVSPLTLSVLSDNEVAINIFDESDQSEISSYNQKTWHVYSGIWADIYVIAPATANTIAKIANGISDNFLTATVLTARCPIVIVPSMDEDMLLNDVTANNISKLKETGYFIMEPKTGDLASGLKGYGRMPEPSEIFDYVSEKLQNFHKDFTNKKVLVTAGPTCEPIDKVRFLSNYSSGKMGFQLAKAASLRGADVTLISGPVSINTPKNVIRIDVKTSDEMFEAVKNVYQSFDIIVMSAAVADFKPKKVIDKKIKKENNSFDNIELTKTVDILKFLGDNKKRYKLIGFALETENETENAKNKLITKNLDLVVLNNPEIEGAGFNTDTNVVKIIDKNNKVTETGKISKFDLANIIFDLIK